MQATRIWYKKNIFTVILSVQKLQNLLEMQRLAPGSGPVAASEPCESFTEMSVSRLSIRRLSAAPLHGTARKPGVPNGDPASVELHLEVGAKVSDLGISHGQIGVPHTGWILQRAEVKTQISIENHSLNTCWWRVWVDGVLFDELHDGEDEEEESGESEWRRGTQSKWHSRGSALRKAPGRRSAGALRESRGYWIKTFGLASVIREDSPGAGWELDRESGDNKKKTKQTLDF